MNRHLSTEQLSAYLDSELGLAEARQIESHCSACPDCRARLDSLRRVVSGLGAAMERLAPPAALRQQIRHQVVNQPPATGARAAFESLRFLLFPVRPALRNAAAMGLAMVIGLFGLNHLEGELVPPPPQPSQEEATAPPRRPSKEKVTVETGAQMGIVLTTSKVADREFVWTDDGWIQRGLEGKTPQAVLDSRSPRGRALLDKLSGLQFLLVEGEPVVLRYNLETVEIRNVPRRVLGFEDLPAQRAGHVPGRSLSA